jgi:hypothetical protein
VESIRNFIFHFFLETTTTVENQPGTTTEANDPITTTEEIGQEITSEESTEYIQQEVMPKQIILNQHDK